MYMAADIHIVDRHKEKSFIKNCIWIMRCFMVNEKIIDRFISYRIVVRVYIACIVAEDKNGDLFYVKKQLLHYYVCMYCM